MRTIQSWFLKPNIISGVINILFLCLLLLSSLSIFVGVLSGGMPFWHDPARDLLLAFDNLKKLTLIGPPSGIPDIFYGPYWIWILSLSILFSKDPRFVVLFVQGIPYLILFPLILYVFKPFSHLIVKFGIVSLFLISYNRYAIYLWNPSLAPFLFCILFAIIFSTQIKSLKRYVLSGFAAGIIITFHISFGIGIFLSTFLFLFLQLAQTVIRSNKKLSEKASRIIVRLGLFLAGSVISFSPFLIFEFRHGWRQVHSFMNAARTSLIDQTSVVTQKGLSQIDIIHTAYKIPQELFAIPLPFVGLFFFICISIGIILLCVTFRKRSHIYCQMLQYLSLSLVVPLSIYLTSKNPVWDYHFIGFEMIILLALGVFLEKIKILRIIFIVWLIYIVSGSVIKTVNSIHNDSRMVSGLSSKMETVRIITEDSKNKPINYFVYAPSLYSFDYDYLFKWLLPGKSSSAVGTSPLYLIIPKSSDPITEDFINYRSPVKLYETERQWNLKDGTMILKRVKAST